MNLRGWIVLISVISVGVFPSLLVAQSSAIDQMWRDLEDMWYRNKVYQGQLVNARSSVSAGVNSYSRSIYVSTHPPANSYGRYEILKGGVKIDFGNSCEGFNITADIFGKIDPDALVDWVTDLATNTLYATLLSYVYSVPGVANAQAWLNKFRELTLTPVISRCNTKRILDVFQSVGPSAPLDPIQRTCITALLSTGAAINYDEALEKCTNVAGVIYGRDSSSAASMFSILGLSNDAANALARSLVSTAPRTCWDQVYESMSPEEQRVVSALLGGKRITMQGGDMVVEDVGVDTAISYYDIYDSVMTWTRRRMDDVFARINNDFTLLTTSSEFKDTLFSLFTPDAILTLDDVLDVLYVFSRRGAGGSSFDTGNRDYQSFRDAVAELNAMYAIDYYHNLVRRYIFACHSSSPPSDWKLVRGRFDMLREEVRDLFSYDRLYRARAYIRTLLLDIRLQQVQLAADVRGGVAPEVIGNP